MLINRLKVAGLLSFGPDGVDLPMEPLNVLIGPNGPGQSNLLEAIVLLKAVPRDVLEPLSRRGGLRDWVWQGPGAPDSMTIEAMVDYPLGAELRHALSLGQMDRRLNPSYPGFLNRGLSPCTEAKPAGTRPRPSAARPFGRYRALTQ